MDLLAACPNEETFAAFFEHALGGDELAAFREHLMACDACDAMYVELGRSYLSGQQILDARRPALGHDPLDWEPPPRVGHLALEGRIGRGGMGVVYLATDERLRRKVAVKFILHAGVDDASARARFERGAQLLANLSSHQNLIAIHETGEIDDHPYLVSEFVDGKPLSSLHRPMPWREALRIGRGLARGLSAVHRLGVLHRDVKPGNVMLDREGEPRLIDFGLAELLDESSVLPEPVVRATAAGTLRYMAPEVCEGELATRRSDVYSTGIMLYELLAADLPAVDDNGALPPIRRLVDDVPEAFARVIDACVSPRPDDRPASGTALRDALDLASAVERHGESVVGNPYRGLEPFQPQHRAAFFGRATLLAAALDHLRSQSMLLLAGDSGVGKSSFCRAALLPEIVDGALGGSRRWSAITMVPGRHPLRAFAAQLATRVRLDEAVLLPWAEHDPVTLARTVRKAHHDGEGLVVFIDQLEEIFTLADPVEARRLSDLLSELGSSAQGVRVVATIRGDFISRLAEQPSLRADLPRALMFVPPLSEAGLREVISSPLLGTGVRFESDELVDDLARSTKDDRGGLPLLQFALSVLWRARDPASGCITAAALEALGGVSGALARHADQVLRRMSPEDQAAAQRVLLRLVGPDGTRLRQSAAELQLEDPAARRAIDALVEGRLVCVGEIDAMPAYEIAHEALLRGWSTFRGWLDADAGEKIIRARIEASTAEWERLRRSDEVLYGPQQLAEAAIADERKLRAPAREFLAVSRLRVRRRLMQRVASIAGVLLLVVAVWVGLRWAGNRETARRLAESYREAQAALASGRGMLADIEKSRHAALAAFENAPWRREAAERAWTESEALALQADGEFARAGQRAESILFRAGEDAAEARALLAASLYERVAWREQAHQRLDEARDLRRRLLAFDEGKALLQQLDAPAALYVKTRPTGAAVEIRRYQPEGEGRLSLSAGRAAGSTPAAIGDLAPGSYLVVVRASDRPPVRYPIFLGRGARRTIEVPIPRRVPDGYVYVPEGDFLYGSAEESERVKWLDADPMRTVHTGAYLIGRTEVTFADWIAFLSDLTPAERAAHRLATADHALRGYVNLSGEPGGSWHIGFKFSGGHLLEARSGERIHYPEREVRADADWLRFPVVGVSLLDVRAYTAWLARKGLRGARPCSEYQWERAARGADGRVFPRGDRLSSDEANLDATYGRKTLAFGLDEVGSFPATESPFGLLDTVGNALESVLSADGHVMYRGGTYYYPMKDARADNRQPGEPTNRDITVGFRVCADAPDID